MKPILPLLILGLVLSIPAIGQYRYVILERGISGDTILGITIPKTSFSIDCDRYYYCIVGCEVAFATDENKMWILDSFCVERVFVNRIYEFDENNNRKLLFSAKGNKDCVHPLDDFWNENTIDDFFDYIFSIVTQSFFNGQRDLSLIPSKVVFYWVEIINKPFEE